MADSNYTITALSYSYRSDIINSGTPSGDLDGDKPHDIEYRLVAHISFKYYLRGKEYAGTCIADLGTLGTLAYTSTDYGIKATTYTAGELDPKLMTYASIESKLNAAVEAEIKEQELKAIADETNKSALAVLEVNPELTFNHEASTSMINDAVYPELDDWNTGIGAYPLNILDM